MEKPDELISLAGLLLQAVVAGTLCSYLWAVLTKWLFDAQGVGMARLCIWVAQLAVFLFVLLFVNALLAPTGWCFGARGSGCRELVGESPGRSGLALVLVAGALGVLQKLALPLSLVVAERTVQRLDRSRPRPVWRPAPRPGGGLSPRATMALVIGLVAAIILGFVTYIVAVWPN